jgi:hypothetical protein
VELTWLSCIRLSAPRAVACRARAAAVSAVLTIHGMCCVPRKVWLFYCGGNTDFSVSFFLVSLNIPRLCQWRRLGCRSLVAWCRSVCAVSSGFKREAMPSRESRCPIAHPLEPSAVPAGARAGCTGSVGVRDLTVLSPAWRYGMAAEAHAHQSAQELSPYGFSGFSAEARPRGPSGFKQAVSCPSLPTSPSLPTKCRTGGSRVSL